MPLSKRSEIRLKVGNLWESGNGYGALHGLKMQTVNLEKLRSNPIPIRTQSTGVKVMRVMQEKITLNGIGLDSGFQENIRNE